MVAKPTWDKYTAECKDKLVPNVTVCELLFTDLYLQIGNLNPYGTSALRMVSYRFAESFLAIDYPVCTEDSPRRYGRAQRTWFLNHVFADASESVKKTVGLEPVEGYEPCEEDYMTAYMNQDSVRAALHVKSDIEWASCSRSIRYVVIVWCSLW